MSSIVTFYSYKGGVGRTMAMANVALLLAQRGLRVLAVDWDLEAPGLERYFGYFSVVPARGGLLRLLRDQHRGSRGHYRQHLTRVAGTLGNRAFTLDVLPSGRETDPAYSAMLEQFDWEQYFGDGGGDFIEELRRRWRSDYDVVLIDSRTGLSDTGGICTIQLPDVVVAMFTANYQSVYGVRDTMRLAQTARTRLAYDRMHLRVLPVPARFSARGDTPEAREWSDRIADVLGEFYRDWLSRDAAPRQVAEVLRIPQIDAFGFGEKLAVVEEDSLMERPMSATYEQLSELLASDIPDTSTILGLQPAATSTASATRKRAVGYDYDLFVARATSPALNEWLDAFVTLLSGLASAKLGRELRVFQDLSEVRVDEVWQDAVAKALARSRALVAIVTPEFLASRWCRLEWATFEWREKATAARDLIVPVVLQRPDSLPDWMARRHMVDISELPRRPSALAESAPEVVTRLAELAQIVVKRVRSAPAFDASWASGADLPVAQLPAAAPMSDAGTSELTLDADALAALLKTEARPEALAAARKLLPTLRRNREYATLKHVAGAIYERDPDDRRSALHYARALVETGDLSGAQKLLTPLLKRLRSSFQFSEAAGLLGRAWKEQFVAAASKRTASARKALSQAIHAYRAGYEKDRRTNLFHGVNLVALVAAARRHDLKIGTRLDEKALARQILSDLEQRPESLRGPWDHAAAAELQLALRDWEAFGRNLQAYMSHPQFESSGLNAFLKQLTELWELESDTSHGAPHIAALRARVLSTPGGSVDMPPATPRAAPPAAHDESPLERVFGDSGLRSVEWFRMGLTRSQSVGVVVDRAGSRMGTCFLVQARDFGVDSNESLVVTAAHIVSSRGGAGAIKPKDAAVVFEASASKGDSRFDVAEELWTSPEDQLDATILRLTKSPTDVVGLPLATSLPSRDEPSRVYVIGYPGGRQLSFSLQDNELLDHEGPPDGTPATPGIVRLHYRAATDSGTSGGAVFDDRWRVLGLHHLAGHAIARLNGQPGTYTASEGIWIQSIVSAFSSGGRRGRVT